MNSPSLALYDRVETVFRLLYGTPGIKGILKQAVQFCTFLLLERHFLLLSLFFAQFRAAMKWLLLLVVAISTVSAYTSFLSLGGRDLISNGVRQFSHRVSLKRSIPSANEASNSPANQFKVTTGASKPAKQSTPAPVIAARPQLSLPRQILDSAKAVEIPIVIGQSQVEAPVAAAKEEEPQLFAVLVPSTEVSTVEAPPTVLPAPELPAQTNYFSVDSGSFVNAAVYRKHTVQVYDVPASNSLGASPEIVIPASAQPLDISFHSQSSPISVRHVHFPGQPGTTEHTSSEEKPEILKQQIIRPIIQEITEVITPKRTLKQEVRPVKETLTQIISRRQSEAKAKEVVKPVATGARTAATITLKPVVFKGDLLRIPTAKPILLAVATKPKATTTTSEVASASK